MRAIWLSFTDCFSIGLSNSLRHPRRLSLHTIDPDDLLLNMDLDDSLRRYVDDRSRLVARLRELSASDWNRTAAHGEYSHYSVLIMFRHLALHDFFHAYRIEELLLKKSGLRNDEL